MVATLTTEPQHNPIAACSRSASNACLRRIFHEQLRLLVSISVSAPIDLRACESAVIFLRLPRDILQNPVSARSHAASNAMRRCAPRE
jgi:hypothetical protein